VYAPPNIRKSMAARAASATAAVRIMSVPIKIDLRIALRKNCALVIFTVCKCRF
jgi:hypothetical protein